MSKNDKTPRLFYWEEGESCWCPAPEGAEYLFDIEGINDKEKLKIEFMRVDMTDEEFENLPEE